MRFVNGRRKAIAILALCFAAAGPGNAAQTDLASAPLASSTSAQVKPNILFILDDSGSMGWNFMPDSVDGEASRVGYKNHLCNTVYYNPNATYSPPKNADGTSFAAASFTAAKYNGYASSTTTADLSTAFKAYDSTTSAGAGDDTPQAAYYYTYSGTQTLVPSQGACRDTSSSGFPHSIAATGGGTWTKVRVSSTSGPGATDERQNFANWYTYYRVRMYMAKAAAGRAFVQVSDAYRVGFITINPGSPVSSSKYLAISDFNAAQRGNWFTKLYSINPSGGTPLREALSRAGRHFAGLSTGINSGMSGDPMQYSCQQCFVILTTDGYWNGNAGQKLDGTAIGNQDGDIGTTPRPMYDNTVSSSSVTTDKSNFYRYSTTGCSGGRRRIQYQTTTITTTTLFSGTTSVGTATTSSGPTAFATATWLTASCTNTPPALPSPNPGRPAAGDQPSTPTGCSAWPCTAAGSGSGGSSNSLSDVAQYYYNTDLRPTGSIGALGTDVSKDNVPANGTGTEDDKAQWQHMTTFTLGMGLSGTLTYQTNYKRATSGDFTDIRNGTKNWPVPSADDPTALDDLWHAAVNGRGQFFSARDPDTVVDGLTSALAGINARLASAAAAATSNLEPVAGDNFAYTAKYVTTKWTGELEAHEIDLTTGDVLSTVVWSAANYLSGLRQRDCDIRNIYLFRSGATNNLVDFKWNTDACDTSTGLPLGSPVTTLNASEQAYFGASQVAQLSQYTAMTDGTSGTPNQRSLAAGSKMVNFLRGQNRNEGFTPGDADALYRAREAVLGDIVNAQPIYVKAPFASYGDADYGAYKTANANRTPMVYVAANDGMLHAFFAGTSTTDPNGGKEAWAFMPTMVLPNLYKLADDNYANIHTYYTDATPRVGDVYDSTASAWKTVLVAGMNGGGKGYYALDITNPVSPKALWEFKWSSTCYNASDSTTWGADCHLGYTFGNPVMGKLANGTWAVFLTSGINNVNSPTVSGDGQGYLYVLNAITGKIIYKISTGSGTSASPSGLNKIVSWVDNTTVNNLVLRVYGVDLQGGIWRFDVNDTITPAGREASLVGRARDPSGNTQPITTTPELAEINGSPYVFVATGRFLGTTDLTDTQVQSIWGIRDPVTSGYADTPPTASLRASLIQRRLVNAGSGSTRTRTIVCSANCDKTDGWVVDLPDSGERVNVDMKLQLGTIVVASNVPQNDACTIGGYSWLNFFDVRTGVEVASSTGGIVGKNLADSLAVGINIVRLPSGRTVVITTTSDAKQTTLEVPFDTPGPGGRRISWREISQ